MSDARRPRDCGSEIGTRKKELDGSRETRGAKEFRPIERQWRKRVKLGEAFRKLGLDKTDSGGNTEWSRHSEKKTTQDTVQKLLVDVLKEFSIIARD